MTIQNAKYKGSLVLNHFTVNDDLVHYFNEDMLEVGYYSKPTDNVKIFDIPRQWDINILKNYRIERI